MTEAFTPAKPITHVQDLDQRSAPLLKAMAGLFGQGQNPHHEAFPEHFGPAEEGPAIIHYLQGFLKPRNPLRHRHGFAKGLFVDGALAGYLLYRLNQSNHVFYGKMRWTCFVEDIVVDENARGLGGASALMGALMAEVEPLTNCAVSGTVWNHNSASEALFRKHGFEPLSQAFYKVSK